MNRSFNTTPKRLTCRGSNESGLVGIGDTTPDGQLDIQSGAAGTIGLVVQAAASQTANLFEAQDSAGTILSYVDKDGIIKAPVTSGNVILGTATTNTPGINMLGYFTNFASGGAINIVDRNTGTANALLTLGSTAYPVAIWNQSASLVAYTSNTGLGTFTGLNPISSDGASLGTASVMWSDLFLASGAVLNFNNGDVTATHSADTLTFAGGAIVLGTATATGGLTGNVTGNVSGTAATVTGAAQTAITSVGTLTGLTVSGTTTIGSGGNTFTFNPASGPVYAGTARPTKRITVTPEYAGATLTGDGSSNTGTMTSDNMTSTPFRNFYNWTSTQGTAQDYDIWVKIPIPSDFSAMASTDAITVEAFSSSLANTTIEVVQVYDTSNTADCTAAVSIEPGTVDTWADTTTTQGCTGGTYAADGIMTIQLRLSSLSSVNARVGRIYIQYLAKF